MSLRCTISKIDEPSLVKTNSSIWILTTARAVDRKRSRMLQHAVYGVIGIPNDVIAPFGSPFERPRDHKAVSMPLTDAMAYSISTVRYCVEPLSYNRTASQPCASA